ncbi:hypothetical protein B9Z55_006755 [Caenorhabditis nigoni]|uniref:dolichyl-P-Man:Man5GlcNAc2-PP-dolichol alpha-1,3-mannosyltransferase n=2 Tax=Caenorhabditis nigoni TaxID=1611254 RepID=A0A2G5V778_9PELO|nr:hypothetical protein B9Z55_006755 [Caenorhabditis nigoni]
MRELASRVILGLFSVNDAGFNAMAAILMIVEAVLSHLVILKVKYTEIDWSTYMQQVECYTNKGILNYTRIGGDTGPIVYPGGHLFTYRILYFLTSSGKNIRLAQHIFQVFYLFNVYMVFRILKKTKRIPPIVLLFVTVTGYRIHSIFMLRLFNDPLAMMLFYVAMDRFLHQKWIVGCVFYSFAVSIKMNVLLFAPALFFTLILNNYFMPTMGYLALCGLIQLYVGGPFLLHDWKSYVQRSFDLGRVFMFKWTVNWRFLPEDLFLDKRFHMALLVGQITFLAIFAYYMWFRRLNGLRHSLYLRAFDGILTSTGPTDTFYAFCTSNLIGIAFSRSLHYQFYSWYFHQLPFLLFCDYPHVNSISKIPWKQFFWKVPLLLAIELCWNVYPSTWWSSALLHICHVIIFWHLISTRVQRPIDAVSWKTFDKIHEEQEMLKNLVEEHDQVIPPTELPDFVEDDDQEKIKEYRMSRMPERREKSKKELERGFQRYYKEQMADGYFQDDFRVYYSDNNEMQVVGIESITDKSKMSVEDRVKTIYAQALNLQKSMSDGEEDEVEEEVDSSDEEIPLEDEENLVKFHLNSEIEEIEVSTDESDECTETEESEDSEEESLESSEEGDEASEGSEEEDSTEDRTSSEEEYEEKTKEQRELDEQNAYIEERIRRTYASLRQHQMQLEARRQNVYA